VKIQVDRRSRDVFAAPAAERAARTAFRESATIDVKGARALAEVETKRAYVLSGFVSAHAWAESVGFGPWHANRLLELGRSLLAVPELTPRVREGKIPAESATMVGRVVRELDLRGAARQAWVEKAETLAARDLRREAEKAIEDAKQGASTLPMRLHVTVKTRDDFQRARLLMSRGERRKITEGQTLGRLASDWLELNDPRRKPLPQRRKGRSTAGRRYKPPREKAEVERRSGSMCEVCGVRRATQMAHLRIPRAHGGTFDARNIVHACSDCHVLLDGGNVAFSHFDGEGRPVFKRGPDVVRERAPPPYVAAVAFG